MRLSLNRVEETGDRGTVAAVYIIAGFVCGPEIPQIGDYELVPAGKAQPSREGGSRLPQSLLQTSVLSSPAPSPRTAAPGTQQQGAAAAAPAPARSPVVIGKDGTPVECTPLGVYRTAEGTKKERVVVKYFLKRGKGDEAELFMACWKKELFADVLATSMKKTVFLTEKTDKGFVNIIGIRR